MKGLLLKDFYVMLKNCKMYFIVSAVYIVGASALSGSFDYVFMFLTLPVVMSGMFGVSLLSFDEKFKWTKYSAALPYSPAQIVLSKYILGFVYQVVTALTMLLALIVWVKTVGGIVFFEAARAFGRMFAISLIIPTVSLPFCFKFGTEKGRIFCMAIVFASALAFSVFAANYTMFINKNILVLIIIAAAVALYAISMAISIAVYKKREITD